MSKALPKGEKIVVVCSENVGQLLENVEKAYPGTLDEAHMMGIIGRGIFPIDGFHKLALFKGEQVILF